LPAFILAIALSGVALGATSTLPRYGSTPVESVRMIYRTSDLHAKVQVLSSTVLANVAVVVIRGTPMDDADRGTPLLLQRFSFGWQPVSVVDAPCDLDRRGITASDEAKLAAGIHLASNSAERCASERDRGSAEDVAAIRRQMFGPVVPFVIVDDGYAFAPEYGDGGGCGLFRKTSDGWEQIGGCKGALTPGVVEQYRIPLNTQCTLGIAETGCPRKRAAH